MNAPTIVDKVDGGPGALRPVLGIARDGWPVIVAFVIGACIVGWIVWWLLPVPAAGVVAALAFVLVAWCVWFFRDPEREPPPDTGLLVSPADGVVCGVGPAVPPEDLGLGASPMTRVSVFMNVFNVHVNRAPCHGIVRRVSYRAGKFFNASFDKASEHNERCGLALETPGGRTVGVVQIAGLIARRIVCRVREGAELGRSQRFGMIRFGSRVDVYLPAGVTPRVSVGDRVFAGRTPIAEAA